MKKIIYGESNFKKVKINNDYLYIDKTEYIKHLENRDENFYIFLRPRRFGKSLFLSTMQYYYDENSKNEFEMLFKNTYIGNNPTPLKNSFKILFFEFSGIEVENRTIEQIKQSVAFSVKLNCQRYLDAYGYNENIVNLNSDEPADIIKAFFEIAQNDKIYILIDEYDQFANAILAHNMKEFLNVVSKGGFVRSFYEVLKSATQTGTVQKMFITGVTPITLDSLSSGFNIVSNISNTEEFNAMAGFVENEVKLSLEETIFKKCPNINKNRILKNLKEWYNGYLFNYKSKDRVYNATLINYFLIQYDYKRCQIPIKMLDPNVASDYKTIMKLFNIGSKEKNYRVLESLINNNSAIGSINDRYDLEKSFTQDDFITLLYSMGFITIKERLFGDKFIFEIPNYVIKILYFNYFAIEIEKRNNLEIRDNISQILIDLAMGNIEPFKEQLEKVIKVLSNRDFMKFDEKHFQSIMLSLLSFASFYFIKSQSEKNHNYPDIILYKREDKVPYNYLFELKWKRKNDNFNTLKQQGIKQVKRYLESEEIKALSKLKSFLVIGSKDGVEFVEVG